MAPKPKKEVRAALAQIGEDPMNRDGKLDFKKLEAGLGQPVYRVRVGAWRIAYTIDTHVVVLRIFHRRDGYGWVADLG